MNKTVLCAAMLAACALLLTGCGDSDDGGEPLEIREVVYTTFYPSTWLADRLCGGEVEVVCPLPEGEDPIFWRPAKEVVRAYQSARVVVVNGARFEKWVGTTSLPPSRIVDLSRSFREEFLTFKEETTHSHGKGEHTHEGIDGHTWVDPHLMKKQAETLANALVTAFPDSADSIRANLAAVKRDLDGLAARLDALDVSRSTLLASHPAYDYMTRRQGWTVANFDLDPAALPSPEQLGELAAAIAGKPNPVMLWESTPVAGAVAALKELNVISLVFSPCESLDASLGADYLEVMNGNISRLEQASSD